MNRQIRNPKFEILNNVKIQSTKFQTLADRWILSRLNTVIQKTIKNIEEYKLGEASRQLYDFIWHEYADWYIEISKMQKKNLNSQIFKILLQLLHPFMPFLTEHIWQLNYKKEKPLIISGWPKTDKNFINKKIEQKFKKIQKEIIGIRKKNPGQKLQDVQIAKTLIV